MQTMQLLVEDEFYSEIMAFLEPFIKEKKIEILQSFWEQNEERNSLLDTNNLPSLDENQ